MEEKICSKCNTKMLGEIPGLFYDFDADPIHKTDGIPLCSDCLGTGIELNNKEFKKLGEEVNKIRSKNFGLQIKAARERKPAREWYPDLDKNNGRLIEIAIEGLKLVGDPVTGCFALELIKQLNSVKKH